MKRNVPNRRFVKKKDNVMPRTKKDWNQDKRIVNVEKKIKKLEMEPESKYFDNVFATPAIATGSNTLLNAMIQGITGSTRLGNAILMTSLQYRFSISSLSTILNPTRYRITFYLDRQPNGAAPVYAQAPGTGPAILCNSPINLYDAPFQYECNKRFKILADIRGVLNPQQDNVAATSMIPLTKVFKGNHRLNIQTKYDTTLGTIADINTNAVGVFFSSDQVNGLTVTGGARLYFRDS